MAERTITTTIQMRKGSESQWSTNNPILAAGEIGVEFYGTEGNTKSRFKIGDGETLWNDLLYIERIDNVLFGVDSMKGDKITGQLFIDSSTGVTEIYRPPLEGATDQVNGTWQEVFTLPKGEKIPKNRLDIGTTLGQIVAVGTGGKIASSLIPHIAITNTFIRDTFAEMLLIPVGDGAEQLQQGDIAILLVDNQTWIFKGGTNIASNWAELKTPLDAVSSVIQLTGDITKSELLTALELENVKNYDIAQEEDAQTGTSDTLYATPKTVSTRITKLIATDVEAKAGTSNTQLATPKTIKTYVDDKIVSNYVPNTRKVNNKVLSADITLGSSDLSDGEDILLITDTYTINGGIA